MTARRGASKDKRAVSALVDAIRTGSLQRGDTDGAAELLSRTLPDAGRLPQPALKILASNTLRRASKLVPFPSFETPPQPVPAARTEFFEHDTPVQPANSNDLLPSVRPKTPVSNGSNVRKRRRVSRIPSDGAELFDQSKSFLVARPSERLDDIGGVSTVLETIRELVEWPLVHTNLYEHLGVSPPRGILLHGPPGCGKTLLAHAIGGELGVSFLRVSGPEVVSGMSGESERKLRGLFTEAVRLQPSIVFIDEVDAIASKREGASKDMERRIVSQLLSCVDSLSLAKTEKDGKQEKEAQNELSDSLRPEESELGEQKDEEGSPSNSSGFTFVIVIAATNRPESLEPALRRAGRFDREIELGAPDQEARAAILQKLCRNLRLGADFEVNTLAKRTAGYVGADLHLLIKEAGLACIRRIAKHPESHFGITAKGENPLRNSKLTQEELRQCDIRMRDFLEALSTIQPSALREGFATRPDISWANIGSLEGVREEMMMAIVEPIKRPELFSSLGLHAPAGVLLYGPPGCGKTLLARAVASESGANFISVKGPELLSKYVGDSELAVRKVFARARSSAPCIIFFDELDALAPRRGGGGSSDSSGASERVVNMLLTEMDGFSERKQVFLIAATNRPDIIDPAMLRPGRLDKLVYVPLPDPEGRASILCTLLKGVKIAGDVDVGGIAKNSAANGYSGADLQALIRTAGEKALREQMSAMTDNDVIHIAQKHFEHALRVVLPSVSDADAERYRHMENWLRKTRGHLKKDTSAEE
ncbi:putative AAA domain-containing protein [Gracilariopsis chorda]|uniref:Putative AAA domain-containing protein n=1 Tax=Gracilariopsis chorda TaxID=448386 RepID=A0A2V3J256_9FLOR|nr:putative AAA domain-containing protein [Gracilariopsis chorda]|eukprot:PXF48455.1 putative AAA domain-containing protein [Gracilariopsis chorda]